MLVLESQLLILSEDEGVAITNFSQENGFKSTYGIFVSYMALSFQLVQVHCSPFHHRMAGDWYRFL